MRAVRRVGSETAAQTGRGRAPSFSAVSGVSLAPAPNVISSSRANELRRNPVPHARKLQPMQQQPHLGRGARPHLDPLPRRRREPAPAAVSTPVLAALNGRRRRKRMNQPRLQVAGVAKIHRRQLFAALVERKKLEIRSRMVQPRHPLSSRAPRPRRHNHLQPAKVPAAHRPCCRQWSSQRIPSVRTPSTMAADSASLTPITASAAVPRSSRPRT